jgi:surface antigen
VRIKRFTKVQKNAILLFRKTKKTFYKWENHIVRLFKKRSFFGLGWFVRQNGSLAMIVAIATLIVFGNISAKSNNDESFLVGHWSQQESRVKKVVHTEIEAESLVLDSGLISDTQIEVKTSEEKETAGEQSDMLVLSDGGDDLLGDAAIHPPRREGASDPENEGDVILYTVKTGDTLSTIAAQHDVTMSTLYWANEIDDIDDISPGDTIFILPTSGLKHKVESGDTIDKIAKEYDVDKQEIIAYNSLPANGELKEGEEIIVPGAQKDIPEPEPLFAPRDYVATGSGSTNLGSSIVKNTAKTRAAGNSFPYGYCTYYVANKRTVTWRGNAGAWLYNAKAQGYSTGKKPKAGSIVVTTEDARYGHVAYVESVGKDTITISEMNYKSWGVVNTRTLSQNARVIRGYIY